MKIRLPKPEAILCAVALGLALAALLCSCKKDEKDEGPVIVVDPGPPFPFGDKRPQIRAAQILDDGGVFVLIEVPQ